MNPNLFRESAEIWKGVTNLPILVFSLFFAVLLCIAKSKRKWQTMFFLLSFDALLGFLVHVFAFPDWLRHSVWCILYAGMYETIRLTFFLISRYETYGKRPHTKAAVFWMIAEFFCFLASCILAVFDRDEDIFVLGGFAVLAFFPLLLFAFSQAERAKDLRKAAAVLTVALAGELLKELLPPAVGVVICHIGITAALYFLFVLAKKDESARA